MAWVKEINQPDLHENLNVIPTQFVMATSGTANCSLRSYNRRDFYKITLVLKGSSELLYANRGIHINKPAIVFTNPLVPYSWEGEALEQTGYFCIFKEEFLRINDRMEYLYDSPLFKAGGDPVFLLDQPQADYLSTIFSRMMTEYDSDYTYKYDILRNHVNLIIHEAVKMQPATTYFKPQNAATRISRLFLELLERQFPTSSPQHSLTLKKAGDYAEKLSVHVNHLNAAVQEITGKSTTAHINERLLMEAKSLLTHTDWSMAEIADGLGFDYASYFNRFFKKHSGLTPLAFRKTL
jgi:AraC family transcriptional regulator, transcriptional activator of pobA